MAYEDEKKGELETLLNDILEDKNENLTPENLKKGVTVLGVDGNYIGTDTSDATATNEDVLEGKTAYAQGQKLTGTLRVEDVDSVLDMFPSIETKISEEIDINDAVENNFNDLSIYGNSEQKSTTGRNLLYEIRDGYLTTVENQEATTTEESQFGNWQINFKNKDGSTSISLEAGEYYVSLDLKINSGSTSMPLNLIALGDKDGQETINNPIPTTKYQRYCFKSILNSAKNVNYIIIQKHYDEEICSFKIKNVMISKMSDYIYEPYTGGNPSPNPDYPQKINSVANMETLLVEDDAIQNKYIESQLNQMFLLKDSDRTKVWQKVMKVYSGKKYTISWNKNTLVDTTNRHGVITNDSDSVVQDFWINPDSETYELTATVDGYLSIGMDKNATTVKVSKQYGEITFKRIGKNIFNKNNDFLDNFYIDPLNKKMVYSIYGNSVIVKCKANTNYTVSRKSILVKDFVAGSVAEYPIDGTPTINVVNGKDKLNITINSGENAKYLIAYIMWSSEGSLQDVLDSIQIEEGSVSTEYEPYQEDEYSVNISNELPRVPTNNDDYTYIENSKKYICDEIDFSKNKLIKRIHRTLLDKEGWEASSTTGDDFFEIIKFIEFPNNLKGKYSTVYSNYFSSTNNNRISIIQNTIWIRFPKSSGIDNLEKAQEFMRTHDVEALYALETPIEIALTDEELSYLEQFPLQKGINHIFSDDDLSPKFKLKYYRDINTMLESEIINNAESKFNIFYDSKVEEFNTNADEKLKGYNTNATSKINEYDTNADNKVTEFNTNADEKLEEFNSNATEKTTAYNDNAEDKLNEYNTNATNKINEYNTNAEAILKILPKTETEVLEEIDIDDSAESSFNKLDVYGNSRQESREGYNVFNYIPYVLDSINGLTIDKDENTGYITINGTPTANISNLFNSFINITDLLEDGEIYTLKQESLQNSNLVYGQIIEENIETQSRNYYATNNTNTKEITVDLSTYIYYANIQAPSAEQTGTLDNFKARFMIYKGTEDKAFELFGVSPSPDYPQEIETIGNNINLFDGEIEEGGYDGNTGEKIVAGNTIRNKNFIDIGNYKTIIFSNDGNGIAVNIFEYDKNYQFIQYTNAHKSNEPFNKTSTTKFINFSKANINMDKIKIEQGLKISSYSPYGMGSVEINKGNKNWCDLSKLNPNNQFIRLEDNLIKIDTTSSSSDINMWYSNNRIIEGLKLPISTYRISIQVIEGILESGNFGIFNNSGLLIFESSLTNINKQTFENKEISSIGIWGVKNTTNCKLRIQIEKGTEATEYEPYHEDVYTLPVQQEMLTGDYIKDVEHHEWKKLIFDENSNMECIHNDKTFQFKFLKHIEGTEVTTKVICNMAKYWNMGVWEENGCFISFDGYFYILCKENEFGFNADMSTDEAITHFKTILANSKLIVYYKLTTPINLELTEEQTAVLNQLEQFSLSKGTNHIFSDDELSPKFKLMYYQDMNILLDKINKSIADVSAEII